MLFQKEKERVREREREVGFDGIQKKRRKKTIKRRILSEEVGVALENRTPLLAEFGNVLSDILILCDSVHVVGFYHCKGTTNEIALG